MSNSQSETLEARLAKRRRLRNRKLLDKNSAVDKSQSTSTNRHPTTTQPLDRKSSERTTAISLYSPITSTRIQNSALSLVENSYSKQNNASSSNKNSSTSLLPEVSKSQSLNFDNEKQAPLKSLSVNELQKKDSYEHEKPIIIEEIASLVIAPAFSSTNIEDYNLIQQETQMNSLSNRDEKSVFIKENFSSILPSIISSTTTKQSNPATQETHENSTLTGLKTLSYNSLDQISSYSQRDPGRRQQYFDYPPFHSKLIAPERIISSNKDKYQSVDSKLAKQNSLACSYLFSKRFIDINLAHISPFDCEQSHRKTVWD